MRLLIYLLLIFNLPIFAQFSTTFNGKHLYTDQFGYYYEVNDTEIKKINNNGEVFTTYSNNMLGIIASIDVSNPYKVLVYFRDFTKVLILDNFLTPTTNEIDLTEIELDETNLVCRSYNDGTWYYNPIKFELIRKNQELQTTNSSGNLANLLNKNIQPNFLIEYNDYIYLNDAEKGIFVFDIYGTYLKTIPIYGLDFFQVKDKYLVYANKNQQIELYDFFTLEKTLYKPLLYNKVKFVQVQNKQIFIVDKKNKLIIDKITD